MEKHKPFSGRRVLVVEDEYIIALDLCAKLRALGCSVVGPAQSVDKALALIEEQTPEAAMLDENLSGVSVGPVAEALQERQIPFVVVSGYEHARSGLSALTSAKRLTKPTSAAALRKAVEEMLRVEAPDVTGAASPSTE